MKQIPWLRVAVEGIVIVGSILLAFGIDAWWEDRGERARLGAVLEGLASDFGQAETDLDRVILFHGAIEEAAARWIVLSRAGQASSDLQPVADSLLSDMLWQPTFDPPMGTLQALLGSGELEMLRDPTLASELTSWAAHVEDLTQIENRWERFAQLQLVPYMNTRVDGFADLIWTDLPVYESMPWQIERTDGYRLLEDEDFEGLASVAWFGAKDALAAAQRVRESQTRILAILPPKAAS